MNMIEKQLENMLYFIIMPNDDNYILSSNVLT